MQPSIGLTVHYRDGEHSRAAIVTEIHPNGVAGITEGPCVDLCVLHRGVQFIHAIRHDANGSPGTYRGVFERDPSFR